MTTNPDPALNTADRRLAYKLATDLARTTESTPDELLAVWDQQQAGDGFTFDVHVGPGERRRYEGYQAKHWLSVRWEAVRLSTDPEFVEALGA